MNIMENQNHYRLFLNPKNVAGTKSHLSNNRFGKC